MKFLVVVRGKAEGVGTARTSDPVPFPPEFVISVTKHLISVPIDGFHEVAEDVDSVFLAGVELGVTPTDDRVLLGYRHTHVCMKHGQESFFKQSWPQS